MLSNRALGATAYSSYSSAKREICPYLPVKYQGPAIGLQFACPAGVGLLAVGLTSRSRVCDRAKCVHFTNQNDCSKSTSTIFYFRGP
jgi:hypothetical protein